MNPLYLSYTSFISNYRIKLDFRLLYVSAIYCIHSQENYSILKTQAGYRMSVNGKHTYSSQLMCSITKIMPLNIKTQVKYCNF